MKNALSRYSLIVVAASLIVGGYYSSTMNYASAIDLYVVTFTGPDQSGSDPDGVRGITYRAADNQWYMTATNNTIIKMDAEDLTYSFIDPLEGGGDCTQPAHILALKDFALLAYDCDEGIQFTSTLPGNAVVNASSDFASGTNFRNHVEWQTGDRLYSHTYANENLFWINLDCVGAECAPSFATGTVSLSTACGADEFVTDITIDEVRDVLWATCTNEVVGLDLTTNTITFQVTVAANLASVSYNAVADRLVVTGYTVGTSDIYVVNPTTGALESTVAMNLQCSNSVSHDTTDEVYIQCPENDTIRIFDISGLTIEAVFTVANIDVTPQTFSNSDVVPSMAYSGEFDTMCTAHNMPDSIASATENYISCIFDDSAEESSGGEECPNGYLCFDLDGDGLWEPDDGEPSFADPDGDGIIDGDLTDFPLLAGNLTERVPFLLSTTTGLPSTSANTILGILVPVGFIVALGIVAGKGDFDVPMFVYALVFMAGMGVSITLGWLEAWWMIVGILGFIASFASKIKGAF